MSQRNKIIIFRFYRMIEKKRLSELNKIVEFAEMTAFLQVKHSM